MNYILDTNILLLYIRDNSTKEFIEQEFNPFGKGNNPIISVVTIGEIKSIATRNKWGIRRLKILDKIFTKLIITDINSGDVIDLYAEIDTYSQNKLDHKPLGLTARNMGKNDLWIAATAASIDGVLLTTDKDFEHLNNVYFTVQRISR